MRCEADVGSTRLRRAYTSPWQTADSLIAMYRSQVLWDQCGLRVSCRLDKTLIGLVS